MFYGDEKFNFLIRGMIFENSKNFFLTLVYMTHGKKSKTIYTDLKYNRYMTDDRNRKSGNPVFKKNSKSCNHDFVHYRHCYVQRR